MSDYIPTLKARGPFYFRRSKANRLRQPKFKRLFLPHLQKSRRVTRCATTLLLRMLGDIRAYGEEYCALSEHTIRAELSKREHVPNKAEASKLRSYMASGDTINIAWHKVFGHYLNSLPTAIRVKYENRFWRRWRRNGRSVRR